MSQDKWIPFETQAPVSVRVDRRAWAEDGNFTVVIPLYYLLDLGLLPESVRMPNAVPAPEVSTQFPPETILTMEVPSSLSADVSDVVLADDRPCEVRSCIHLVGVPPWLGARGIRLVKSDRYQDPQPPIS